jgi:hypothetical protein
VKCEPGQMLPIVSVQKVSCAGVELGGGSSHNVDDLRQLLELDRASWRVVAIADEAVRRRR